jgi:hypothetical protein
MTCMFKKSLLLLQDSCSTPLPAKLYALTHPPSLLASWGKLWTFDLDKSHVRGRYNCVRDIRRSNCQPFCACVSLSRSEHMLAPSWSRENCLAKIFCLLCVCFQHRRVINSNIMEKKHMQDWDFHLSGFIFVTSHIGDNKFEYFC